MTTNPDMMTAAPARVLGQHIADYLKTAEAGAWTVGEFGWDGAVQLCHPFRPQARVYSLEAAQAHIAKHA